MLSSVSSHCGRLATQIQHRKSTRNSRKSNATPVRRYATGNENPEAAETQDPSRPVKRVNNIFDSLKNSYKKDPFLASSGRSSSSSAPNAPSVATDALRNIAGSSGAGSARRAATDFAMGFRGTMATRNATNPISDASPEFGRIIMLGRDRQNADVLATWRSVVQARPDILAPPKVLRAVLLAYVQTLPDWIHMAKLFEDYLRQEKLTSDLAAHAVRSFAAALRYEEAIKVYEQIESGALTPRFSKPHFEAMFFRNVVDAYGGLKRFDDVQRIVDHCAAKLPKESLSTLIVGAMNALVDNDRAEDAMKLFNRAHQEYKIPVDNQLSNAMRRAKHPILLQRLEQTSNDETLFGRFLTRTSSPEETISDAWKAYEESQQAGTKLGFSAHLVLMQLLHAVPKHALSGERAARIYAEAVDKSSELVNDSTSLTSFYMELLINRGEVEKFDELYSKEMTSKPPHIRPATYEFIMNYFLSQKKDAQRALQIWHEFVQHCGHFTPTMCNLAFDILEATQSAEEAFELFSVLKSAERGIVVARIGYDRVISFAIASKDAQKVRSIAEDAVWATYQGILAQDNACLRRAREFLTQAGQTELRADKLIAARLEAEKAGKISSEVVIEFNDSVFDQVSPSLNNPKEFLQKFIPST